MNQADYIWMNGELVRWEDAKVHVLTHALHYGSAVFEGVRAYETKRGTAVFRYREHLERLHRSAELYYMELPYTLEKLREATHEVIAVNKLSELLHPPDRLPRLRRDGPLPAERSGRRRDRRLAVGRLPRRGRPAPRDPLQGRLLARMSTDSFIPQAKASGQYLNSILAKVETAKAGYDEAIMLDQHGNVSEGSGENIFIVRDGGSTRRRRTPRSLTASRPAPWADRL